MIAGGADMPFCGTPRRRSPTRCPTAMSLLDGQGHNVDPTVLAPVLKEFFAA